MVDARLFTRATYQVLGFSVPMVEPNCDSSGEGTESQAGSGDSITGRADLAASSAAFRCLILSEYQGHENLQEHTACVQVEYV